jgi:hypothetical protein
MKKTIIKNIFAFILTLLLFPALCFCGPEYFTPFVDQTDTILLNRSINTDLIFKVQNNNTGSSATASFLLRGETADLGFGATSDAYNLIPAWQGGSAIYNTTGTGINIATLNNGVIDLQGALTVSMLKLDPTNSLITFSLPVAFAAYTRTIDVTGNFINLGATTGRNGATDFAIGYILDDDTNDLIGISFRVPADWNTSSDMTLELIWSSEDTDAIADTEIVVFDLNYVCKAEGEDVTTGTAVSTGVTYTQSEAGTNAEQMRSDITLDYDNANQPIAAGDYIHMMLNRDTTTDTYSGSVYLHSGKIHFNSVALPQ